MASLVKLRARKTTPVPHALRNPFRQTNRRRDDVFIERMLPGVPQTSKALQAWVSSWAEPRIGITELPSEVWGCLRGQTSSTTSCFGSGPSGDWASRRPRGVPR